MTGKIRKPFNIISAAVLTLMIAACATAPTPYQAATEDGGYTDKKTGADRYQVTFQGNEATPKQSIEDAALFRAAQVAYKAEKSYFQVVSSKTEPVADKGHVNALDIVVLDEQTSDNGGDIYNARDVITELNTKVQRLSTPAIGSNGAIVNDLRKPRTRDY